MQGVAAKNEAPYDLSRALASVTGQTTIATFAATMSPPNGRIVTALFAGALFLGAFLLFVLEPMVAKSILPTLGVLASDPRVERLAKLLLRVVEIPDLGPANCVTICVALSRFSRVDLPHAHAHTRGW